MSCSFQLNCPDSLGCPDGVCPDFVIKRHDTEPSFIASVNDCNGPLDLTDCVVEVSMWAKAKLKKDVADTDTTIQLADGIGFQQIMIGDIIVLERARDPEQLLATAFDEINKIIYVTRGQNGTTAGNFKKGNSVKIFRVLNAMGSTNMVTEDVTGLDGTTTTLITDSQLVYNWSAGDTCLAGCYWLEFKLLKMSVAAINAAVEQGITQITTSIPSGFCDLGQFVLWARRFPIEDGFLIKITDTPTQSA